MFLTILVFSKYWSLAASLMQIFRRWNKSEDIFTWCYRTVKDSLIREIMIMCQAPLQVKNKFASLKYWVLILGDNTLLSLPVTFSPYEKCVTLYVILWTSKYFGIMLECPSTEAHNLLCLITVPSSIYSISHSIKAQLSIYRLWNPRPWRR